jgi:glycosyltransferase involved in cell wall biosynthesis
LYGGKFKRGFFYRILAWLDKLTVKDAAAAVVLSRDMGDSLRERGLTGSNIAVINNMVINEATAAEAVLPPSLRTRSGVFRVIFAGNLGNFQGLETIVDAAKLLAEHTDIEFLFLGNGLAKPALVEQAGGLVGQTVLFHDFVPMDVAYKAIEVADVGVVCLQENVYKVAYPSKTMMLLNAGCPLLLVVEPESEISHFVNREKLGCACPPGDPRKVADAILAMSSSRESWRKERDRIRRVAGNHFGQGVILQRWSELVNNLPAVSGGAR